MKTGLSVPHASSMLLPTNTVLKPPKKFHDPTLGHFEGDDGLWTAVIKRGDGSWDLTVGGSNSAPSASLISAAIKMLPCFEEHRRMALALLTKQEILAHSKDFAILGLSFLWEHRPDEFTIEFTMAGNEGSIWRVGFVSGKTAYTGRDD